MTIQGAGKAVSIVKQAKKAGKTQSYELDEAALAAILNDPQIKNKKVAVLSVAGAYRKGKSFLLNFFVLYLEWLQNGGASRKSKDDEWFSVDTVLDKFHWTGGSERDTHGIYLWDKPFVIEGDDGEEMVVLLMDTQGTFDSHSTVKECATIFALSTMLSSLQIFNVSQNIQEDDLQHLRLFTEYAKLARKNSDQTPFQSLLFLVRDWPNSDEFDYGFDGGEDFLTRKLKTSSTQPKELQELRRELRASFDKLLCFLMPHPGLKVANNNKRKNLGPVEPDFEEQLAQLVPALFSGEYLETKTMNGGEITCGELVQYFKTYMTVFSGDTLPTPKSIYQASVDASNAAAFAKAKAAYLDTMNTVANREPLLADFQVLDKQHELAKEAALKSFKTASRLGDESLGLPYLEDLKKAIQERYTELKRVVDERKKLADRRREQEKLERERAEAARVERERLTKVADEQRKEMERLQKLKVEEERRAEETRRQLREQAEKQRLAREEDERRAESRRRELKEEEERQRRQMAEQAEQKRKELAEEEAQHKRRMAEERREAEERRRSEAAAQREMMQQAQMARMMSSSSYSPSPFYGCPSPSRSFSSSGGGGGGGGSSNVRFDASCNRYRDYTTGRFARNPNS